MATRPPTARCLRGARRIDAVARPATAPDAGGLSGVFQADGPDAVVEAVQGGGCRTLKVLIAAGKVKPFIDRRFPLGQIVDALEYVDEGRARGKVVVTV